MEPKISVIVPVYNCEEYLNFCIESILNQTFTDFELILINDGSTDKSGEICNFYAGQDNRIKVIHQDNMGVSTARNKGIDTANGHYIMFVDCDDTIDDDFLDKSYEKMTSNKFDVYISGIVMEFWENNNISNVISFKIKKTRIMNSRELLEACGVEFPEICISGPCAKIYKKNILDKYKIRFKENMNRGEDTCFNLDVIKHSNTYYFDESIFYHYRRSNNESLFSVYKRDIYNIYLYLMDKHIDLLQEKNCSEIAFEVKLKSHFILLDASILDCIDKYSEFSYKDKIQHIKYICSDKYLKQMKYSYFSRITRKGYLFCMKHKLARIIYIYLTKVSRKRMK